MERQAKPLTLKEARTRKGLSLSELAGRVQCGKSTLSRLENGLCDPMWGTVQKLERELGVSLRFTRTEAA